MWDGGRGRRRTLRSMRIALLGAFLAAALVLPLPAIGRSTSSPSCGVRHAGPDVPAGATDAGALCLLRAFEGGCRSASYQLSLFGIDTIASDTFSLHSRAGRCSVGVVASFEVVPSHKRVSSGLCTTLQRHAGDIVAAGCTGVGLPHQISLTGAS